MRGVIWTLKELSELMDARRNNEFDVNVLVTGGTGLGKSTFIQKLLSKFSDFNPHKHQTYSRTETISLLRDCKKSFCWNDELISSGYKRMHYEKEQIDLIQTLTKYRCNYNIFVGALPVFFTLDKELLKLFAINVDVIKRGVAVIHMRKEGRRYTDDPWDTKINAKLEEKWSAIRQKNPNFEIQYNKYTTFVGYIYWNPLTDQQKLEYEKIRDEKKKLLEDNKEGGIVEKSFYESLLELIEKKQVNEDALKSICLLQGKQYKTVRLKLNQMLEAKGIKERLADIMGTKKPKFDPIKNDNILKELSDI